MNLTLSLEKLEFVLLVLLGMRTDPKSKLPNIWSTLELLERREKVKLLAVWSFRITSNLLDIAALAGIALLASAVARIGGGQANKSNIPFMPDFSIDASMAVLIAFLVASLFFVKSLFSAWFGYWTGTHVTKVESRLAARLLRVYFDPRTSVRGSYNLASMQNTLVNSLYSLISIQLIAAISASAEAALLALLVIGFGLVNPVATITLIAYLAIFLLVMNKAVTRRLQIQAQKAYLASETTQQSIRNLYNIRVETSLLGQGEKWLKVILDARRNYGTSAVNMQFLSGLPRYVIESALVFGLFAFIGALVVFSDLPSQAVTVGVFLTGGLRLVASILPLQAAVHSYKQAVTAGESAFQALKSGQGNLEPVRQRIQFLSGLGGGIGFSIYEPERESWQDNKTLEVELLRVSPERK